jgi:hypothetical protein
MSALPSKALTISMPSIYTMRSKESDSTAPSNSKQGSQSHP